MTPIGEIKIGATWRYAVAPRQVGETITGTLKRLPLDGSIPPSSSPALFEFSISNAADIDGQLGWYLELSSTQTHTLSEGMYVFDERIVLANGDVQYNDSTLVYVKGTIDDGPN